MNPKEISAERRLRLLFEELVDLDDDARATRVRQLDQGDPNFERLVHLLDAHDHTGERLDAFDFLRPRHDRAPMHSGFDAAAAFAPDYVIEGELAGGGMSRVFFGHDVRLGRKIAAKVLPPELGAEVSLARFQQEMRVAAQLRHPHIVPLLESGEAAGCLYYTMPFIEGESLRDRLRRDGPMSVPAALHVATEIADALAYAHGRGVIHRDIKPGNVLLDSGHAVVTDFGIARALHDAVTASVTRSGTVIGTPAYMSPEQASGDGAVDSRSDIYSLGCVLHEMLYGAPPFGGGASLAPSGRAPQVRVPARVRAIVARAMAPRAADRYASALEMHVALRAAAEPRVSPRAVWTAVAAVVVLGVGAWMAFRPAVDRSFGGPGVMVRQVTTRGDVKLAAITPGGAYLAFVTSDTGILRIADIEAGTQTAVETGYRLRAPDPLAIKQVAWSRDGERLYFLNTPFYAVEVLSKLGPWRMAIANPLLMRDDGVAGGGFYNPATGFAVSPVDSSVVSWRAPPKSRDDMRRRSYPKRVVYLHARTRPSFHVDTIDVRLDMHWAVVGFSPNGRWFAACGGSRDHDDAWRLALISADGATQRMLDSADVARGSCGVFWSQRGDSLYVWPKTPGTGLTSYPIDQETGRLLGPPVPFRLRLPPGGERTSFSLSADGKRLAYVERKVQRFVGVAEMGAGIDVASRDAEVGARDPRWPTISPTGDRFAYVVVSDSGSAIYTRDVRGGEPHQLSRGYREGLSGVRWSDDGARIATLTRQDSQTVILVMDATGTELMTVRPRHVLRDTSLYRPSFDWAAGGTAIMYSTMNAAKDRAEVWLFDLASGQERRVIAADDGFGSQGPALPVWSPDGRSILYDSLGQLIIKDAATGVRRAAPPSGGVTPVCPSSVLPLCETGTMVPLRWRADGTFFSERLNLDGSTTIWKSSLRRSPTLYAHLAKDCKLVSMDRDARRAVCQVYREESDVFVATRP